MKDLRESLGYGGDRVESQAAEGGPWREAEAPWPGHEAPSYAWGRAARAGTATWADGAPERPAAREALEGPVVPPGALRDAGCETWRALAGSRAGSALASATAATITPFTID